jgi:GR25 family glycosyltransferase involved in LPS biosynthesis
MHIYCINLERSTKRRESALQEFEREGLEVEFFPATDGKVEAPENIFLTDAEWGCAMSHVRIWRDIVEKGYETALIFEDDVTLNTNFVSKLEKVLDNLPPDWDFVNLGAESISRVDYKNYTDNLKVGQSLTTHAYLIHSSHARNISVINPNHLKDPIDTFLYRYPSYNLHLSKPIALQRNNDSIIGIARTYDIYFILKKIWVVIILILVLAYIYRKRIFG